MIDSARQIRYTVICKETTGFNGEEFLWITKRQLLRSFCFDNSDVITTSGLDGTNSCTAWSSKNGYTCHSGLQMSGGDLKSPLS